MVEAAIIVSRFLHFTATLVLFGISIFPFYTYRGSVGAAPMQGHRSLYAITWWAALTALLSAIFWFAGVNANMTGSLEGAFDPNVAWSVLSGTGFGRVWTARFILVSVILLLLTARMNPLSYQKLLPALCGALLGSLASVGHTQIEDGITGFFHVVTDGLHLLAAGAWLGGLVSLFYVVARQSCSAPPTGGAEATQAALRFSSMGYIVVATLIGTGLINSWYLVGPFANLTTPYGQLLMLKLALFAGMLGLAALNRFLLVPNLINANEFGGRAVAIAKLRRHIIGEQVLGVLIVIIVSALGTMEPPINPA